MRESWRWEFIRIFSKPTFFFRWQSESYQIEITYRFIGRREVLGFEELHDIRDEIAIILEVFSETCSTSAKSICRSVQIQFICGDDGGDFCRFQGIKTFWQIVNLYNIYWAYLIYLGLLIRRIYMSYIWCSYARIVSLISKSYIELYMRARCIALYVCIDALLKNESGV